MSCTIGSPNCPSANQCPVGSLFTLNSGTGTCNTCTTSTIADRGYYCNNGIVTICPAGYYCPFTAGATPVICPDGYICREGFESPMECTPLSICSEGTTTKKPGAGAIVILVIMIVVLVLAIKLVQMLRTRRGKKSNSAAQKHKGAAKAFGEVVQAVTGVSSMTTKAAPLQGFNEKIRYVNPVAIEFKNLGMTLKINGAVVLEGVTGEFPPGSLVAVMGGSGAGKSTFMNALANRAPYGNVSGQVSLNGVIGETIGKYPRLVGFVPQDDIMHDDLTVYENLLYSARLRLPPSMSTEQQRAIVEDVIEILDLNRIRDAVVGSPEKRGISGGQKKRVNIGMELVAYPRVLFLDEPTSGLDSAASLQVARCLQRMRSLGITVVTVIHQPRYSVFRCFSHCLLLAKGGKTAYLGPTGVIQGYFESCGFELPKGENVADWFIDIVSGQVVRKQDDGSVDRDFVPEQDLPKIWNLRGTELIARLLANTSSVEGGISKQLSGGVLAANGQIVVSQMHVLHELEAVLNLPLDEEITAKDLARLFRVKEIDASAGSIEALYRQLVDSVPQGQQLTTRSLTVLIVKSTKDNDEAGATPVTGGVSNEKLVNRPGPTFCNQVSSLVARNLAKFDTGELIVKSLIAAAGAIIVAFTFKGPLDYASIPVNTQSGLILFAIISAASFLYVFGDERLVFTRESQTGFSITAYWFAKNLVNLLDIFVITIFFYTFYFVITQPDYLYRAGLSVYLLLAWYTSAVSHFFSVVLPPSSALLMAVLVPAIEISLLAGIKPTFSTATNFQKFLSYITCGYYSVEDLTIFEIRALPDYVQELEPVTNMMTTYSYNIDHLTRNSLIMLALGIAVRLLTYACLQLKVRNYPIKTWWMARKENKRQRKEARRIASN